MIRKNYLFVYLIAFVCSAGTSNVFAQTVWTSVGNGAWTSAATWSRSGTSGGTSSTPPNSLGNSQRVVINGHTVTMSNSLSLDGSARLTIQNSGKLSMDNGQNFEMKSNSNQFIINNGTYENVSPSNSGNFGIDAGTITWTNASVVIGGNLEFKTNASGSMTNVCMQIGGNTGIEGLGSSLSRAILTDVYMVTGKSGSGNFSVTSSSFLTVSNWRIKVGSNSGNTEFSNSNIQGSIYSIDGNDKITTSSLTGSPSLAYYCADVLSPNLNSFSGTKINNCSLATAQNCTGIPPLDADGDGVIDNLDDFPTDGFRAFRVPYPTTGYATLLFEDLWPFKGDYDFNDLVIDYKYETISNSSNNVVEVKYTFVLKAIGAGLHNGFGFQLDNIAPNKITSVSANPKTNNATWLSLNANGTEAGQTFANIILFDDVFKSLPWPGTGSMVNVYQTGPNANPYVTPDTTRITVTFLNNGVAPSGGTLAASSLPSSAFNPYLICGEQGSWNQLRNKEIHLPNRIPSSKASNLYFGQGIDDSNPSIGRYYKSDTNLPWAMEIFESIPHMKEKLDFSTGYNYFLPWVQSNGTTNTTWFQNNPGNRNNANLYIR